MNPTLLAVAILAIMLTGCASAPSSPEDRAIAAAAMANVGAMFRPTPGPMLLHPQRVYCVNCR